MRRVAFFLVGILVMLGVVAGGTMLLQRNGEQAELRGMVVAALQKRTGLPVSLAAVRFRLLPWPRLQADGLVVGDALRVGHLSAGIEAWPLLSHVVRLDPLSLDQVRVRLVRDARGRSNWDIRPQHGRAGAGDSISAGGGHWRVELGGVRVRAGELSLQDAQSHHSGVLHLGSLAASSLEGNRPQISLNGTASGADYVLEGETGPIRLLLGGTGSAKAWPVSLRGSETVAGLVVGRGRVAGTFSDPLHGHGYDFAIAIETGQLAALNRLFPHAGLPAIQDLNASGHLVDSGQPSLVSLRAKAGPTVLPWMRGLKLQSWSLAAAAPGSPVEVAAGGSWRGQPLSLKGTLASLGAVDALLSRRPAATAPVPVPVRLTLGLGSSSWRIHGMAGAGASDVRVQGVLPDARTLWTRAPEVGPLTLEARLQAQQGTMFRLTGLRLLSAAADLQGALTLSLQGHPTLSGELQATRIDADRLTRLPPAPFPMAATSAAKGGVATPQTASPPAGLPWPILRMADADISLQVGRLLARGGTWRDVVMHLALRRGKLLVDPLRASGSEARIEADASLSPPTLNLWMHPLMLPAGLLARWLDVAALLAGDAELVGEIGAHGTSGPALVASAAGHVGLSMTDGTLSNAALARLVGASPVLAASIGSEGTTALRCLALHAVLGNAEARLDTLSLRTARISLDGGGRIDLSDGGLDLHLLAGASMGTAALSAPVRLQGTIRDPHAVLDAAAPAHRYGLTIGTADDSAALGCDGPLRSAREGITGPAPAPVKTVSGKRKAPKPVDILRSLGLLH